MKKVLFVLILSFIASMSFAFQASISVPNGTGLQVRTATNNALQAIATKQSGASAPTTTYPFMWWMDTSAADPVLKIRNSTNSSWVTTGVLKNTGSFDFSAASLWDGVSYRYASPTPTANQIPVLNSSGQLKIGNYLTHGVVSGYSTFGWDSLGSSYSSSSQTILGSNVYHSGGWKRQVTGTAKMLSVESGASGIDSLKFYAANSDAAGSTVTWDVYNGVKIWHAGNDGTASTLDADLLDGLNSGNSDGNIPISNGVKNINLNADKLDDYHYTDFRMLNQKIAGDTVQIRYIQNGSYQTITSLIPRDNTTPTISEGTQVLSQTITPTAVNSLITIDSVVQFGTNTVNTAVCTVFKDNTPISVSSMSLGGPDWLGSMPLQTVMIAGTTSTITVTVRCGLVVSGTMYVNGVSSSGALFASSSGTFLKMVEIKQ